MFDVPVLLQRDHEKVSPRRGGTHTLDLYYRGGSKLSARTDEVKLDHATNRLKSSHGVSVYNRSDYHNLNAHGGAYALGKIPIELRVIQRGEDTSPYEIVPAQALALTFAEYQEYFGQIVLTRVGPSGEGE